MAGKRPKTSQKPLSALAGDTTAVIYNGDQPLYFSLNDLKYVRFLELKMRFSYRSQHTRGLTLPKKVKIA